MRQKVFTVNVFALLIICVFTLTANAEWMHESNPLGVSIVDSFTVEFEAQPTVDALDGGVSLLKSETPGEFNDHACLIRFNADNFIDVRNGDGYAKEQDVPYSAGQTFLVKICGSLETSTYSVWVTSPDGAESQIAQNYTYRTAQVGVDSLRNWGKFYNSDIGVVLVSNVYVIYASGVDEWLHTNVTPLGVVLTDSFVVEFDTEPVVDGVDGGVGILKGDNPAHWNDYACLIRFNPDNLIDVRNGDSYAKDADVAYAAGNKYHIKIAGNIPNSTYDVWVTSPGDTQYVQIANNYTFRTAQIGVDSLLNCGVFYNSLTGPAKFSNSYVVYSTPEQWAHNHTTPLGFSLTNTFEVEFDVKPVVPGVDGGVGVLKGDNPTHWNDYACLVRFNADNFIDARNGDSYAKDADVPYEPMKLYHVKIAGDIPNSSYSVWVTSPEDAQEVQIADGYTFRTAQVGVDTLKNWGIFYNTIIGPALVYNVVTTPQSLTGIRHDYTNNVKTFELKQNYPNPFNPTTLIAYNLANKEAVKLTVYNALGQRVKCLVDNTENAGYHVVLWDGTDLSGNKVGNGLYFYKLETKSFNMTRKMILLK